MPTALVTGANRGLGLELVRQYGLDGWDVIAVCRNPGAAVELRRLGDRNDALLDVVAADLADIGSVDALAARLDGRPVDILVNNAGVFGPKRKAHGDYGQSFGHIDYETWADVLRVNTLAPVKIAEALLANVVASDQKKLVTVTSRLGSIAETDAGLYAYRTSKAAVNMAMATLAKEPATEDAIIAVFNPGWVQTDMGGADAPLGAEQSVASLREQFARLQPADSGGFFDYDGRPIAW